MDHWLFCCCCGFFVVFVLVCCILFVVVFMWGSFLLLLLLLLLFFTTLPCFTLTINTSKIKKERYLIRQYNIQTFDTIIFFNYRITREANTKVTYLN